MKTRMRTFPLLIIVLITVWMGLKAHDTLAVAMVSDEVASDIRGGGCGNVWKDKAIDCAATLKCDNVLTECTTDVTDIETAGDGDQIKDPLTNNTAFCKVCNLSKETCGGGVTYTRGTKQCVTSTSG